MTGILGSGFGLYGYLPAIVHATSEKIVLLENSREKFNTRGEIQFCKERIVWVKTLDDFINRVDLAILAVPPSAQASLIERLVNIDRLKKILIEKPVAISPHYSSILLERLVNAGKLFVVGYTFLYTDWARLLTNHFKVGNAPSEMVIQWNFLAHHYRSDLHNWKRYHSQGGGVLRFYGIHLVALASVLGFYIVESVCDGFSIDDLSKWRATFRNEEGSRINVVIDTHSSSSLFEINSSGTHGINHLQVKLIDPFDENQNDFGDKRINLLTKMYAQFEELKPDDCALYSRINELWSDVEKVTDYRLLHANCLS
jgi:predicted dehydrogenase